LAIAHLAIGVGGAGLPASLLEARLLALSASQDVCEPPCAGLPASLLGAPVLLALLALSALSAFWGAHAAHAVQPALLGASTICVERSAGQQGRSGGVEARLAQGGVWTPGARLHHRCDGVAQRQSDLQSPLGVPVFGPECEQTCEA
jgi:hypothetical protein